jgi:hypothetical protein
VRKVEKESLKQALTQLNIAKKESERKADRDCLRVMNYYAMS